MVPVIDMDSFPVPPAEGTTYRKRNRVDRSKSRTRPDRGGATTGCRSAVLLTGQAAFAVRSCCLPASTVWAGTPPFRRSAIESCVQSAASPRRPRLCALPCSLLAQAVGALRRYLPAPHTRAMDKLSPVGNNCISSGTSSVSPRCFFARLISKHEASARWSGFGTMLIARVQGSREAVGSVVLCMLMVSWTRVEEAAELAWRAFITNYSATELVVAVFLVLWRQLSRPQDRDVISTLLADLRSMAFRLAPPLPPPPPEPD
ncbi:uncharacterized protein LOC119316444 [Triticum dicoccoides]|uniref:uncharacterized protein LOC119316444 n=1 Tax=Triticum dicoccoides TaxID=85692 RepID=UPI0018913C2A|nr:uncharacterized protein LOC119316444 [Triticum dicoccoides]